jgi:large subunit ribosomal protein L21|uniref:50S ribosomal protein L21, chloroplastic n=1 Tax=Thorea hispida TaxID=202687 RepID=A0A1C9CAJ3_9FLOR|nr:ribosomal protein L21 [Thorea hispida]AOM65401.1 ribosomal protein L21 [Thorea hispida]ARX95771.1 50S ribosomal protein L21 [Thorea hispida]UNJ79214.1 ribosomal protein L21 [Thorea hispida]
MIYAVVEASGKQWSVKPGHFYDFNRVSAKSGQIIQFNKILLVCNNGQLLVGKPCLINVCIKGKILKHLKGKKVTSFKMRPKKNIRLKKGHRQQLSRILIESIKL